MKDVTATSSALFKSLPVFKAPTSLVRNYGMVIVLLGVIITFSLASPFFATFQNAVNILNQVAVIGIVAVGMTFVILTSGIDLSVGSMLAVCSLVSAEFSVQTDPSLFIKILAFAAPVVLGAIMGGVNGTLVATGYIAPFVVTLATLGAFRGFAVWYHANPIYGLPSWYRALGVESVFGTIPYSVLMYLTVVVLASLTLNRTKFGRRVYAVGGNEHASRASGINVARVKFAVYVISGVCVGLAVILQNGRVGGGQSYAGDGMELRAIAAVIIGGVSLFGGRGSISNAVTGTLVLGVLFNGLVLLNVPSPIQVIIIGAILVAAVMFDGIFGRRG
jgi:ribose/xylose/arabinose/galactoside ABC-type transport system permease subunit